MLGGAASGVKYGGNAGAIYAQAVMRETEKRASESERKGPQGRDAQ